MTHVYSVTKDGYLFVWTWKEDYVSEDYKKFRNFEKFKTGRKIKLEDGPKEVEEEGYSAFEKKVESGRFILEKKHQFYQNASRVKSVEFFEGLDLLILGFKNGTFGLYHVQGPEITEMQTFSITDTKISTICLNGNGSWIAFGMQELGQLLVWEWRS